MTNFPWVQVLVMVIAGLIGTVAVVPYQFALNPGVLAKANMSRAKLILLTLVQGVITIAIVVGVGLLASRAVGLGAPVLETILAGGDASALLAEFAPLALLGGVLAYGLIVALDRLVFMPRLPQPLRAAGNRAATWKRALACLYGGITEELMMRWFLMSVIVWAVGLVWHGADGLPADGAYWVGIIGAAVLFGVGHLPATSAIARLTPWIITRALLLNGIGGLVFGLLYWRYGLEAAMLAHFTADVLLHIVTPIFTQRAEAAPLNAAQSQG
jgi:hypothetical protein